MSDDEEYYDDCDDIFWIEEPEPDAADDLAATATYDAVFFEDPSFEADEYYSDWDELSDDYYDEDPTIKRRKRMAELTNRKPTGQGPQTIWRRKQSNDTQNGGGGTTRVVSSKVPDPTSFQSVVWKRPEHDKNPVQIMVPGEGEKVALLKNWREVFKNSHPSFGRSRAWRQQKVLDYLDNSVPEFAPPGPVKDLVVEDETSRDVSTDRTSGDSGSGGYVSNTTLERSVSPPSVQDDKVVNPALVNDLPMNDDPSQPPAPSNKENNNHNPDTTSGAPPPASSPVKGKKRKASISIDEDQSKGRKSKRVAAGQDTQAAPASGPVRRSARQTRSQK
ncbi:hypothetical protein SI65_03836 [Aspergillus cristatus]|uniref:Uncharacterized protein n=1 Tax=Aspergillus cristatus TaxID=573508 RepID=A0A1E3BII9_ASPCR|nr:hypothetical protein SI65_03836 [Aspergillus cristatus]